MTSPLRIAFVPGVTLTKWTRTWEERRRGTPLEFVPTDDPAGALTREEADVAFARLPIVTDGLSVIRLYSEAHVVVVSADDAIKAMDEVVLADLDGYTLHDPAGNVDDTIALVAAGVGAVILPHAIARAHARKDLISRPVTDAPETDIAIAWLEDAETADIEEFVGIVRGRSANSSRGGTIAPRKEKIDPDLQIAKEKPEKKAVVKPRGKYVHRSTARPQGKRRRQGR